MTMFCHLDTISLNFIETNRLFWNSYFFLFDKIYNFDYYWLWDSIQIVTFS